MHSDLQEIANQERAPENPEALKLWKMALEHFTTAELYRKTNWGKFSNLIRRGVAFQTAAREVERAFNCPV